MHLQDPNWCRLDRFMWSPLFRLRCNVSSFVEIDDATGRSNCPKADHLYIFGTESGNVESCFGRNGSNLFVAQL